MLIFKILQRKKNQFFMYKKRKKTGNLNSNNRTFTFTTRTNNKEIMQKNTEKNKTNLQKNTNCPKNYKTNLKFSSAATCTSNSSPDSTLSKFVLLTGGDIRRLVYHTRPERTLLDFIHYPIRDVLRD